MLTPDEIQQTFFAVHELARPPMLRARSGSPGAQAVSWPDDLGAGLSRHRSGPVGTWPRPVGHESGGPTLRDLLKRIAAWAASGAFPHPSANPSAGGARTLPQGLRGVVFFMGSFSSEPHRARLLARRKRTRRGLPARRNLCVLLAPRLRLAEESPRRVLLRPAALPMAAGSARFQTCSSFPPSAFES